MTIAERIAAKRHELAVFVTENANAVLSEQMTEEVRGSVALDLLRLMVSSGLSATPGPMLDVSPQPRAISKHAHRPPPSDYDIAAALASEPTIQTAAKKLRCGIVPVMAFMKRGGLAPTPERQDNDAPATPEALPPSPVVEVPPASGVGKRRYTVNRKKGTLTDAILLEAVARHGNNSKAVAAELGLSPSYVNVHRRRLGISSPKGWTTAAKNAERAGEPVPRVENPVKVIWNDANRIKLAEIAMRSPRPRAAEIALEFGTTESGIQTALSRYGITKDVTGVPQGELRDLSGMKRIACMTCQEPFVSEGKHNRRCNRCKGNDHKVAA